MVIDGGQSSDWTDPRQLSKRWFELEVVVVVNDGCCSSRQQPLVV